jgi:TatD DNase family protein
MSKKKKRVIPPVKVDFPMADSHAHVINKFYEGEKDAILKNAFDAGLEYILNIGIDLETSKEVVQMAETHPGLYAAVGHHPHEAGDFNQDTLEQMQHLVTENVVAIGETGIDFHYDYAKPEEQYFSFESQIGLASENDLPVIVHSREAHKETYDMIKKHSDKVSFLLHCFSGDSEWAKKYVDLGCYISFPGVITFKKSIVGQEAVKAVPADRIMFETDCPFLTPHPLRGRRNEPANVNYTLRFAADLRGISAEELAAQHVANFKRFFNIP